MKKRIFALLLTLCLMLCGCGVPEAPDTAADGTPWSDEWTTIGAILGVEPIDGWRNTRNEDLLADEGMYFATWVTGEAKDSVYPAQTFLVLSQCEDTGAAEALIAQWTDLVNENYTAEAPRKLDHKLGSFTLIPYTCGEGSTFARGMTCVGLVGNRAVNLEISCMENVELDLEGAVTAFLNGFHFAD